MNAVKRTGIFVGGVILAAGVAGFLFTVHRKADVTAQNLARAVELDGVALRAENGRLREENARLRKGLTETHTRNVSAQAAEVVEADPALSRLRLLADLQKRRVAGIGFSILSSGRLTDQFIELFGLTAEQRLALQGDLDNAREGMIHLQMKAATVSRNSNGAMVINVSPLVESPQIYDEVLDAFAKSLGPDRNAIFLALGESQLTRAYNNFGAETHAFTVSRIPSGPLKDATYDIVDRSQTPNSNGTSNSRLDRKRLEDFLPVVARLLPADF